MITAASNSNSNRNNFNNNSNRKTAKTFLEIDETYQ